MSWFFSPRSPRHEFEVGNSYSLKKKFHPDSTNTEFKDIASFKNKYHCYNNEHYLEMCVNVIYEIIGTFHFLKITDITGTYIGDEPDRGGGAFFTKGAKKFQVTRVEYVLMTINTLKNGSKTTSFKQNTIKIVPYSEAKPIVDKLTLGTIITHLDSILSTDNVQHLIATIADTLEIKELEKETGITGGYRKSRKQRKSRKPRKSIKKRK